MHSYSLLERSASAAIYTYHFSLTLCKNITCNLIQTRQFMFGNVATDIFVLSSDWTREMSVLFLLP
jgi:hypothetical protein